MGYKKKQQKQFQHETAMADKTLAANTQLQLQEYQQNRQSWHEQNEYNSPESQQARFKAAGLNPNLMYGQGDHGNAKTLPQYQAPTADYNNVASPDLSPEQSMSQIQQLMNNSMAAMGQYMDVKTKARNLDLLDANTLNKDWDTNQKQLDYAQKKNLYGQGTEKDPVTESRTKYNQQLVDKKQAEIDLMSRTSMVKQLEAQLKRKDISKHERDEIQTWIKTLRSYLPY